MLISEYLRLRNQAETQALTSQTESTQNNNKDAENSPFALELKTRLAAESGLDLTGELSQPTTAEQLEIMSGVNFSRHAVDRINQRHIDVMSFDTLERLNRGVELAESKGSDDALVIVDKTAFVVSVKANKVVTAVSADDVQGNVFTNIDSTVIM